LLKTLDEMATYFGADRQISVSRELTKMFEETVSAVRWPRLKPILKHTRVKGEFVICVAGAETDKKKKKYGDEEEED
jgi:16S rRNA (cytidine1402-2'-O)-methyltransferase